MLKDSGLAVFVALSLVVLTVVFGTSLSSLYVVADSATTKVSANASVIVPEACTLSGTNMTSHTAEIPNGTSNSNIGETTMKAYCNDSGGFAVYAVGYTDNEYGKSVLTNAQLGNTHDIATGTGTSGSSQWAMKVSTIASPTPTYPVTIENSFDAFHTVPNVFTMVASRNSGTDVGTNAEGSTMKTTYQAYMSSTQLAGTYTGQVKYTLIHPSTYPEPVGDNEIGVLYDGNGLYFDQAGTKATNKVLYERRCEDEYGYIGDTPTILKTRNLNADGTQNGPYSVDGGTYYDGNGLDPSYVEFEGASKVKIEIRYGLSQYVGYFSLAVDGNTMDDDSDFFNTSIDRSGTATYVYEGSSISMYSELGSSATNTGYDYGVYIEVYPIYDEPTDGATYGLVQNTCSYQPTVGTYATIAEGGNDMWFIKQGDTVTRFYNEEQILDYLEQHSEELQGSSIIIYASNAYTIVFDANGGSGTMANQKVYQYYYTRVNENTFTKPHQEVVSWNTEPDGTGTKIFASNDYYSEDYIIEPLASAGDTVRLYAQWGNCTRSHICYDDNGANSSTAMGKDTMDFSTRLSASNFQRSGYGFAGWNTRSDGTGQNYGPNQTNSYTNAQRRAEGVRLYAMWVPSAGNIQNWSGCPNLAENSVTALADIRDGNVYAVAKLADGNCWMIENLRLGGTSPITLTTADTQSAGVLPASIDTFGTSGTGQYMNAKNTLSPSGLYTYSYGNYYSTAAAINGTTNTTTISNTVDTSICPAGWHLPFLEGNGGFTYLLAQISSDQVSQLVRYPYNFIFSGSYYNNGINNPRSMGHYWLNVPITSNNQSYSFSIYTAGSGTYSFGIGYQYIGQSVRCVLGP